jgi:cellulose biosynthesis protein BcsQ
MPIRALANSKGGGGKSTIAACIAAELHRRKKAVSMLDADPQETLTGVSQCSRLSLLCTQVPCSS